MTLQKKIIILIVCTILGLIILLSLSSALIISRKFAEIEKSTIQQTMKRVMYSIFQKIQNLETVVKDWAQWDDTYEFMNTEDEGYIKSNLLDETFVALGVNLIGFIDNSGNPVWLGYRDQRNSGLRTDYPAFIKNLLGDEVIFRAINSPSLSGLYLTDVGVMMVSTHQVLTSKGQGPPNGIVIMGRVVDEDIMKDLSGVNQLQVFISQRTPVNVSSKISGVVSSFNLPEIFENRQDGKSDTELPKFDMKPKSRDVIYGEIFLEDLHGRPEILVTAEIPRIVYSQSSVTILLFISAIVIVTSGFLLVYLLFLEKYVLFRLGALTQAVVEVGKSGDFERRIPLDEKKDELSLLALEINTMMARLSDSRRALADSEKKYATLVEQNNDGIIILKNGDIVYANSVFCTMLGIGSDKVLGKPLLKFVTGDNIPLACRYFSDHEDGKQTGRFEMELVRGTGARLPVEMNVKSIELAGERCEMVVVHNLTEQKWVTEQLRLQAQLLDLSMDSIFVTDTSHNIIFANLVACRSYGYTQEQFLKMNLKQLVAPDCRPLIEVHEKELNANGQAQFETVHVHKNGSRLPVEMRCCVTEWGRRQVFICTARDITDRKLTEAQLRLQMDIIDRILAHTPNAVVVLDLNFKIVFANRAFYQQFEREIEGKEGKSFVEILPVETLVGALDRVSRKITMETDIEFTYKIGELNSIYQSKIVNMNTGEILVILYDVTRERERQERLYLADRLVSIGEMSSGLAHELNNPLTSIVGLSQLLLEDPLPDAIKEDVRNIHSEALRAVEIIRNLLTFVRKHQDEKQHVDMHQIIEDILKLRSYEHRIHNIQVVRHYSSDLPPVMANRFQIQQVFLNIILNAEDAMIEAHGKGTLTIGTEFTGNMVRISFTDDGTGIKEDVLKHIFDPFFTTKAVGKGTGLGLSISYGIINAHGGRIYARSRYGHGATFVVELPVNGE